MESAGLVVDALGRVRDMVRGALKDLSPEELLAPPKPHIAWLVWHLSRVQDANLSGLMERPQLWIAHGWHARFNMPPDPRDYGSGHRQTPAQVEAFTVNDKTASVGLPRRRLCENEGLSLQRFECRSESSAE
jgi:DinB superfamily